MDRDTQSQCFRDAPRQHHGERFRGMARDLGSWTQEIDGADVVINLAGRSVNCRYTSANRREIMDSRVLSRV